MTAPLIDRLTDVADHFLDGSPEKGAILDAIARIAELEQAEACLQPFDHEFVYVKVAP